MTVKIVTTFSSKVPTFLNLARNVKTSMTDNPYFSNISADFAAALALLDPGITKLQNSYDDAQSRDSKKIAIKNTALKEVTATLMRIAKFTDLHADGDETILKSSGFELTRTDSKKTKISEPLQAPVVEMGHGEEEGTLVVKAKPVPGMVAVEVQITDGDPTVPENYVPYATFAHCTRILITGRTAGKKYSVRLRFIGNTRPGFWSSPCTLMSL